MKKGSISFTGYDFEFEVIEHEDKAPEHLQGPTPFGPICTEGPASFVSNGNYIFSDPRFKMFAVRMRLGGLLIAGYQHSFIDIERDLDLQIIEAMRELMIDCEK